MAKEVTAKKREIVFLKYNGKCAYCGKEIAYNNFHVDHINPLFRKWTKQELSNYNIVKGTSQIENLNPSCASCNISKSTFSIEEWRNQIYLKIERLHKESTNFRILEAFGLIKRIKNDIVFYFEKHPAEEREVYNG